MDFKQLVKEAGLWNPFEPATLQRIAADLLYSS